VPQSRFRIVIDTNTLLRGLVTDNSAAAKALRAAEARLFVPLVSKPILDEYRAVLSNPMIVAKFPEITPDLVEVTLRRLRFVGDYLRSPKTKFELARDPRDEKFIELATDLRATHILSFDKDLLSLPSNQGEAGMRFRQLLPGVKVMEAGTFLQEYAAERTA